MKGQFNFTDVVITEEDITDEMIREECISYLVDAAKQSEILKESVTLAEHERFIDWIRELDTDSVVGLVFGEQQDVAAKKDFLRRAAVKVGTAIGKGTKGIVKGTKVVGAGIKKGAVAVGKGVKTGAVAVGKGAKASTQSVGRAWHSGTAGKVAIGGAAAVAAGLAARAIYKRYFSQCAKECKGAADRADCMARCKEAARQRARAAQGKA